MLKNGEPVQWKRSMRGVSYWIFANSCQTKFNNQHFKMKHFVNTKHWAMQQYRGEWIDLINCYLYFMYGVLAYVHFLLQSEAKNVQMWHLLISFLIIFVRFQFAPSPVPSLLALLDFHLFHSDKKREMNHSYCTLKLVIKWWRVRRN